MNPPVQGSPESTPRLPLTGNLFAGLSSRPLSQEVIEVLWQTGPLRLERIISHGQATPPGEWYDQATDEWVVLLTGAARLCIEGCPSLLDMRPGDHVLLPAHLRHRVEWTDPNADTVWLALHVLPGGNLVLS